MTTINVQTTVGDLVTQRPSRSRVFEDLGIDYCCGGKKPLAEVCQAKGLDPEMVLKVMLAAERGCKADEGPTCCANAAAKEDKWADASLTLLADYIEVTHHAYMKRELPRLTEIIHKVASVHGQNHSELPQVERVFAGLASEMTEHMMKEERILFPMIRQLDASRSRPRFHCGSIANPIRMMEHEHDSAGQALAEIRQLTSNYAVPDGACNTYRAMLEGLEQMEYDLHQHVHKENNILFPRAVAMEKQLSS